MNGSASLFLVFQKAHFQPTDGARPLAMYTGGNAAKDDVSRFC